MEERFLALAVHGRPEALGEIVELLTTPRLKVETARSTTEAMHRLRATEYAVIIAGHKPPVLDGVALLERSVAYLPDCMRILVVPSHDLIAELDDRPADAAPIFRIVGRGYERANLTGLVEQGIKLLGLVRHQRALNTRIGIEHERLQKRETLLDMVVKERTKGLEESLENLKRAHRQALFGLAEAIEAKDSYTKGHCGRVAGYTLALATEMNYPDDQLETLEFGAFLHDIGKIGVRDAVLLKPGPLDEAEWQHMREHPVLGYEIAKQIEFLLPVIGAVRNHHERWDGNGYPDKLVAERIPLPGRLVAIADAFDALATDRPYKAALPLQECETLLRKNAGKMFDPELVEMFCERHVGALYRTDFDAVASESLRASEDLLAELCGDDIDSPAE